MSDTNFPNPEDYLPTSPAHDLPAIALDERGYLTTEFQCIACGYNLQGLLPDSRCPECGTAIGRSVHGDLLRFSEPEWVEILSSGMNWIVANIIASILFSCSVGIAGSTGMAMKSPETFTGTAVLVGLVLGLMQLIGYWKLTTPEPTQYFEDAQWDARTVARYSVVINFILSIFSSTANMSPTPPGVINHVISVVGAVIGLVTLIAILIYVRRLAMRIPNPGLASNTRTVMIGLIVAMAAGVLTAVMALVAVISAASSGGGSGFNDFIGVMAIGLIAGLCYLVFGLWGLILIFRYRKAFALSAQEARTTWAAQPMEEPLR